MSQSTKFQRLSDASVSRLIEAHGVNAPAVLRNMADELEWLLRVLAAERKAMLVARQLGFGLAGLVLSRGRKAN